jgi:hypothetical protein
MRTCPAGLPPPVGRHQLPQRSSTYFMFTHDQLSRPHLGCVSEQENRALQRLWRRRMNELACLSTSSSTPGGTSTLFRNGPVHRPVRRGALLLEGPTDQDAREIFTRAHLAPHASPRSRRAPGTAALRPSAAMVGCPAHDTHTRFTPLQRVRRFSALICWTRSCRQHISAPAATIPANRSLGPRRSKLASSRAPKAPAAEFVREGGSSPWMNRLADVCQTTQVGVGRGP